MKHDARSAGGSTASNRFRGESDVAEVLAGGSFVSRPTPAAATAISLVSNFQNLIPALPANPWIDRNGIHSSIKNRYSPLCSLVSLDFFI